LGRPGERSSRRKIVRAIGILAELAASFSRKIFTGLGQNCVGRQVLARLGAQIGVLVTAHPGAMVAAHPSALPDAVRPGAGWPTKAPAAVLPSEAGAALKRYPYPDPAQEAQGAGQAWEGVTLEIAIASIKASCGEASTIKEMTAGTNAAVPKLVLGLV